MAKYKVVRAFSDLKDNKHSYKVGDKYPRKGRVNKERIEELLSLDNKLKYAVIAVVEEGDE